MVVCVSAGRRDRHESKHGTSAVTETGGCLFARDVRERFRCSCPVILPFPQLGFRQR